MVDSTPWICLGHYRIRLWSKWSCLSLHHRSPAPPVGSPNHSTSHRHRHVRPHRSTPAIPPPSYPAISHDSSSENRLVIPQDTTLLGIHLFKRGTRLWLLVPRSLLAFLCCVHWSHGEKWCIASCADEYGSSPRTIHLWMVI